MTILMESPRVLDAQEAAAYLAFSETTLHRLVRWRQLPAIRAGQRLGFRVEDLDAYLIRRSAVPKWEYLFVEVEEERRIPRPVTINGELLDDWKKGPSIYEFAEQLGADGWELVTAHGGEKGVLVGLIFKRQSFEGAPRPG